ncbi:MAG: tRNA (N6-threonylcarbamoyladenosine(37)-N6)-methyltransferase TrmO [Bdellovibrio sp.]|nr:tRNA (N6-threonylcarbamoyladenosine(37)-N6)-methyltransferase TrmO [Bdellovibrio sp.]
MLNLRSIGLFESPQKEPYQASRQPDPLGSFGRIRLNKGENFEQALQDLEGCSHIWLIFGFHHNENWKPLVQTPRSDRKIGVFATRAPYRPNPIGLSLVKLISVDGLVVSVAENDLLDGTPIYDIKPYHPEADIASDAKIEWLENSVTGKFEIHISPVAELHLGFLESHGMREIRPFVQRQLLYDPLNKDKKRVEENNGYYTLAYRTWRIDFAATENVIAILLIRSGYSEADLQSLDDTYKDKDLHRQFVKEF